MQHRALSLATGTIATVAVAAFLAFGAASDRAMPKSGIGDIYKFGQLSGYAGVAFYVGLASWLVCLVFAQLAPQPYRGRALFGFGLILPLCGFVVWLVLLGATSA